MGLAVLRLCASVKGRASCAVVCHFQEHGGGVETVESFVAALSTLTMAKGFPASIIILNIAFPPDPPDLPQSSSSKGSFSRRVPSE